MVVALTFAIRPAAAQAPDGAEILVPGCTCSSGTIVRAVDVPPGPDPWWGVYIESNVLRLRSVRVETLTWASGAPRPAACDQDVAPRPTWLIHGVSGLSAGQTTIATADPDGVMWPGRTLAAEGRTKGTRAEVATLAASGRASAGPVPRVAEYHLVYRDPRGTFELAGPDEFNGDLRVWVHFLGDVDGDGHVDVFLGSGQVDDANPSVLWLSSGVPAGALLRPAAAQVHADCG